MIISSNSSSSSSSSSGSSNAIVIIIIIIIIIIIKYCLDVWKCSHFKNSRLLLLPGDKIERLPKFCKEVFSKSW